MTSRRCRRGATTQSIDLGHRSHSVSVKSIAECSGPHDSQKQAPFFGSLSESNSSRRFYVHPQPEDLLMAQTRSGWEERLRTDALLTADSAQSTCLVGHSLAALPHASRCRACHSLATSACAPVGIAHVANSPEASGRVKTRSTKSVQILRFVTRPYADTHPISDAAVGV